ncbi:hypothetical protein D7Y15_08110 [Corallococcus sp. AB030]|uniref:ParB N-terminal domain-containing protein n=1 Tax=Corallococcus sp. AB030 TaxID=2316716 RepID=UPI000EF0F62D|nr:ParB N-terminal domain-containing protein [Corallococcus sp. AB030]RKI18652.1 hypothetical protein D7Y15_08110 [Corallococcus sp. AB030]
MDINNIPGVIDIPLTDIVPPHEVRDKAKLEAIRASMEAHDWKGRPLVVVPYPSADRTFLALTGSHRLAAADAAGLEVAPCYVATLGDAMYVHTTPQGDWLYSVKRGDRIEQEDMAEYFSPVDPIAMGLLVEEVTANAEELIERVVKQRR